MLMDLFSIFDMHETKQVIFPLWMWVFTFFPLMIFFLNDVWLSTNKIDLVRSLLLDFSYNMANLGVTSTHLSGMVSFIQCLWLYALTSSMYSMIPYVFKISAHALFTFYFCLGFWMSLAVSSIMWNPSKFIQQFIPTGCPIYLSLIIFMLEQLSFVVRFLTLLMRFTANMCMGSIIQHLLAYPLYHSILELSWPFNIVSICYSIIEVLQCIVSWDWSGLYNVIMGDNSSFDSLIYLDFFRGNLPSFLNWLVFFPSLCCTLFFCVLGPIIFMFEIFVVVFQSAILCILCSVYAGEHSE